uniref:C2H2-type domain-containing protein n=1 Tax=Glossina brevipalpis TaxID=37001 RepID=A0A1A9VZJ8_9MUSC
MEKAINEKLELLQTYIPFIDFALTFLDHKESDKFQNLKASIINKERLSLDFLIQIEKAIQCQYRKLSDEDIKIPIQIRLVLEKKIVIEEIESSENNNSDDFVFRHMKSNLDTEEMEEEMNVQDSSMLYKRRSDFTNSADYAKSNVRDSTAVVNSEIALPRKTTNSQQEQDADSGIEIIENCPAKHGIQKDGNSANIRAAKVWNTLNKVDRYNLMQLMTTVYDRSINAHPGICTQHAVNTNSVALPYQRKLEKKDGEIDDMRRQKEVEKQITKTGNVGEMEKLESNRKKEAQQQLVAEKQIEEPVIAKEAKNLKSSEKNSKTNEAQQQIVAEKQVKEAEIVKGRENRQLKRKKSEKDETQKQIGKEKQIKERVAAKGKRMIELEKKHNKKDGTGEQNEEPADFKGKKSKKRGQKNEIQQGMEVEISMTDILTTKDTVTRELRKKHNSKDRAPQQMEVQKQIVEAVAAKKTEKLKPKKKDSRKKEVPQQITEENRIKKDVRLKDLKEFKSKKRDSLQQTEFESQTKTSVDNRILKKRGLKRQENKKNEPQIELIEQMETEKRIERSTLQNIKDQKLSKISKVSQKLFTNNEKENSPIDQEKNKTTQTQHFTTSQKKNVDKFDKLFSKMECTKKSNEQIGDCLPNNSNTQGLAISPDQLNNTEPQSDNGKDKRRTRARGRYTEDDTFDSESSGSSFRRNCQLVIDNQPCISLPCLGDIQSQKPKNRSSGLSKLRRRNTVCTEKQAFHAHLVEEGSEIADIHQNEKSTSNVIKDKKRNINHKMTEMNTSFCTLCKTRPYNLVNHYITRHKTESYVSRLTEAQLRDMAINTNFAESKICTNSSFKSYEVTCPFCNDVIIQPFMVLRSHISAHTGEYAYGCSSCSMTKPFRADIKSHQGHAKKCFNANISILYRYPEDALVIYLHYCSLCNYVQMNEANILKHLHEQHSPHDAVQANIKNCILAATRATSDPQLGENIPKSITAQSNLNQLENDASSEKLNCVIENEMDEGLEMPNELLAEAVGMNDFPTREVHHFVNGDRTTPPLSSSYSQFESLPNHVPNDELQRNMSGLVKIVDRPMEGKTCYNEPYAENIVMDNGTTGLQIAEVHWSTKENEATPGINSSTQCVSPLSMDSVQSLKLVSLADEVSSNIIKNISNQRINDSNKRELSQLVVTPDLRKLIDLNENIAKSQLRTLTQSTGVAPDNLYRCLESTCDNVFPSFETWLQHVRVYHDSLLYYCPHCSSVNSEPKPLDLEKFETHFEEHRGHTYICLKCLGTFKYEEELRMHSLITHQYDKWNFEQIRYNDSYCYFVLIQKELYEHRLTFLLRLVELLVSRQRKLKEEKLQHEWVIPKATNWLKNFPLSVCSREITKKCVESGCNFLTTEDDVLSNHLRNEHEIAGHDFSWVQCVFKIEHFESWDPILEHLKLHSDSYVHICCLCSLHHRYRSQLRSHIEQKHDKIMITRGENVFIEVAFVFARGSSCFSTIRNCFCCEKRGKKPDELVSHLMYYHELTLSNYCELCYKCFEDVQSFDDHFKATHDLEKRKLYCKLAFRSNPAVQSIQPFQLQVGNGVDIEDEEAIMCSL